MTIYESTIDNFMRYFLQRRTQSQMIREMI